MAKARNQLNLLAGLVDSDSEDDFDVSVKKTVLTNMPAAKKGGRPAANKVTKPASKSTRRSSGRIAAAVEQVGGRQALADKTNEQATVAPKRGRKGAGKTVVEAQETAASPPPKPTKGTRGRPKAVKVAQDDETDEIPDSTKARKMPASTKTANKSKKVAPSKSDEVHEEIPETQEADAMEVDGDEDVQMEELPVVRRAEAQSAQRASSIAPIRRPASASESEQNDPLLRRRLGDLTKKYDNLEAKYRDLREIGVKEAERNFDRLKKQSDEKTKSANELIASLKAEVAAQKELAKEYARFRKQWEASDEKVDQLQVKVTEMTTMLSETKTENKALSAKLAAARAAEAGSASTATMGVSTQANTHTAQMKEDLYGDLTGLIVRGVKRESEQDVYDCIQTGRNGTLHFKLSVGKEGANDSYDEAQFMYMPQLDANRDQALVEMLPDYLVEEITFPRPHAAKFYSRVMRSLTERIE